MPSKQSHLETVRSAAMFSALDDESLSRLLKECPTRRFDTGALIFHAGRAAEAFYLVIEGRVKIFHLSPKGDEQILHLYGPGDTFGEAAMFTQASFPANAQAIEPARLMVVRRAVLLRLVSSNAEIALGMLAGLSAKLREFASLIEDLSLKEVPARLAGVLLRESGDGRLSEFRLSGTKRELAASIGTVSETLSRALGKLKSAGIISVRGSRIRILDADRLREVAENVGFRA